MRCTRARVMPCAAGAPVRVAGLCHAAIVRPGAGSRANCGAGMPCGRRGHAVGMARVCRGHAMRGALWRGLRGMAANARGRVARGMAGVFWARGAAFWRVAWRGE